MKKRRPRAFYVFPCAIRRMKQCRTCLPNCSSPRVSTLSRTEPIRWPAKWSIESLIPKATSSSSPPCHHSNRATAGCYGSASATAIPISRSSSASGPAPTRRTACPRPRTTLQAKSRRRSPKRCHSCVQWPCSAISLQKPPSAGAIKDSKRRGLSPLSSHAQENRVEIDVTARSHFIPTCIKIRRKPDCDAAARQSSHGSRTQIEQGDNI